MRPIQHQIFANRAGGVVRLRSAVFALVVAAHALLMLVLLRMAPPDFATVPGAIVVELLPDISNTEQTPEKRQRAVQPRERIAAPRPSVPTAPNEPAEEPFELDIIELTREEYATSHIAKLPSRGSAASNAEATDDGGHAAEQGTAQASGTGPNGERLYDADWYRKPTQAELAYYLPRGAAPIGWATIACRTVADYRVDDCVELAQSPAGSGLARAVAQAAWQFRVWPPRLGGRPLVGAWVRIRIDFSAAH
jgi:protein TonB